LTGVNHRGGGMRGWRSVPLKLMQRRRRSARRRAHRPIEELIISITIVDRLVHYRRAGQGLRCCTSRRSLHSISST
jgi:hypothetical protein